MKKVAVVCLAAILLCAGVLAFLHRRRSIGTDANGTNADTPRIVLLPAPEVALQINRASELQVQKGTPLIFTVSVANPRAMNASVVNEVNQALAQEIEAGIGVGTISRQSGEEQLASLHQPLPIPSVRLGDANTSWKEYVHFSLLTPDGQSTALRWNLQLAEPPEQPSLLLAGSETAQLEYLLDPSTAEQITAGNYQVFVSLQPPVGKQVAADTWNGSVQSEPVALSIISGPEPTTPQEVEAFHLEFARYYQEAKDWTHALDAAQKALSANPDSISASIIVGEVKQAQGDTKGALESFQDSLTRFYAQYPKSYEPPSYILDRIASLQQEQN